MRLHPRSGLLFAVLTLTNALPADPTFGESSASEHHEIALPEEHPDTGARGLQWGTLRMAAQLAVRAEIVRPVGEERSAHSGAVERLRFEVTGQPGRSCRFSVALDDSRAISSGSAEAFQPVRDSLDASHAWMECGTSEGPGWLVRAGRQSLSFGDERLISSDAEWSHLGFRFDATRLEIRSTSASIVLFTAIPVAVVHGGWNKMSRTQRLHGVYASRRIGKLLIDPYVLTTTDALDASVRHTFGIHMRGTIAGRYDHNLELAIQRGRESGSRIRARGIHLEVGRIFGPAENGARISAEYNSGSGDSDPFDSRSEAFTDLYAAAYNKYGAGDPFRVRNLQNMELSVEWQASRRVKLASGYRTYWLVKSTDYLYPSADDPRALSPTAGLHAADQVQLSAVYRVASNWKVALGLGQLIRRKPLNPVGLLSPSVTVFLALTRNF
jgi:hypothetical protein